MDLGDLHGLPGAELILQGLHDLGRGDESINALLVLIGGPRLRSLGVEVPVEDHVGLPEHRLYARLSAEDAPTAHSRYNALIRRLVSFERALACEPVDLARLRAFMRALADATRQPLQVYLVGGATAVFEGWRDSTIDVDLKLGEESDLVLRAIPAIKEALNLNIELASPADFIPLKAGWEERSPFVAQEGTVTFRHFDLYAQALARIERGHETDRRDVAELLRRGLVELPRLQEYFDAIEPDLYRFPAIDPGSFRRAVEAVTKPAG